MGRFVARLCAVLVILAAYGFAEAAPAHAAQGVTVQITQLPGEFTAGGQPGPVTVVATRSRGGCSKLRWSLVLRAEGARLDRVRVDRIEEDGSFPVNVERDGNSERITDRQLDPGTLCRDRTVTARYRIVFAGDAVDAGARVTLAAEALSTGGELLDRTTVTREVRLAGASPSPEPTAADAAPAPAQSGTPAAGAGAGLDADRASDSGVIRVGPIGLAVGAVMVLVGLGLLVKVRRRSRGVAPRSTQPRTTQRPAAQRRTTQRLTAQRRTTQRLTAQRQTTQRRGKTRPTLTLPPLRR